jgi:acetyltransferase-like isoleucine patch superfamily enzyme
MTFAHLGDRVVIYEPCFILKPEMIDIDDDSRVDSLCKLEGGNGITIGRWVHVSSFCHLNIGGGTLIVGDGVGIASGAKVVTGSNMPEGEFMSAAAPRDRQVIKRSYVDVGAKAFIGSGAIVMPGLTIGEGAVVGAGAVVTHDVEPWTIVAGVPARKIGDRARV